MRATAKGVVRAVDGSIWPSAHVELISRPLGRVESAGDVDVLRVDSDARGRFSVDLLRGRTYTAWAHGDDGEVSTRVSSSDSTVRVGPLIRLREISPCARLDLQIRGIDKWKYKPPLRYRFAAMADNLILRTAEVGKDGRVRVPVLPDGGCALQLFDADGYAIYQDYLSTSITHRNKHRKDPHFQLVEIPEPCRLSLTCVSLKGSTPVAGAKVYTEWQTQWVLLGLTDDQGKFLFQSAPSSYQPKNGKLRLQRPECLIHADGFGEYYVNLMDPSRFLQHTKRDGRNFDINCRLAKHAMLEGRLMSNNSKPLARHPIVLRSDLYEMAPQRFTGSTNLDRVHQTDDEGRFRIPVPGRYPAMLQPRFVLWSPIEDPRSHRTSTVLLWTASNRMPDWNHAGNLVIEDFEQVRLQARNSDGSAANDARVTIYPARNRNERHCTEPFIYRTDRKGRLDVLLTSSEYEFGVEALGGLGIGKIPARTEDEEKRQPIVIHVSDPIVVRGRIVNEKKEALADVGLSWSYNSIRGGTGRYIEPLKYLILRGMRMKEVKTDTNGAFELLFPLPDIEYGLRGTTTKGNGFSSRSLKPLKVGKDPITGLELVLTGVEARKE
jgi:hypothetical protein